MKEIYKKYVNAYIFRWKFAYKCVMLDVIGSLYCPKGASIKMKANTFM